MPARDFAEWLLRPIMEAVLYVLGYCTGKAIIPILTLGRRHAESFGGDTRPRPRYRKAPRSVPPQLVSADTAALCGLLFWLVIIIVAVLMWRSLARS